MLSYRHGFHAGNHADVLKHLTLVALLRHFLRKDKPFTYIDSHAGAGLYDLGSSAALKTGEAASGIGRLQHQSVDDPLVNDYLEQVRRHNHVASLATSSDLSHPPGLSIYPGSPALALSLLRPADQACLIELHNNEIEVLRHHFRDDPRVSIHHRDACEGLRALTPPMPRRGLALIDPAYEVQADYDDMEFALHDIHRKWPVGTLVLWYPLLATARDRSDQLKRGLTQGNISSLLCVELAVTAQKADYGMHGSGLLIVNSPWQLDRQLHGALQTLAPILCEPDATGAHVEWLLEPA